MSGPLRILTLDTLVRAKRAKFEATAVQARLVRSYRPQTTFQLLLPNFLRTLMKRHTCAAPIPCCTSSNAFCCIYEAQTL